MTGADLRNRRKALGLSQAALAQRLGTTKNTVARWERGEITIAKPEMLELALRQIERERKERTMSLYVIQDRDDITLSQDLQSEVANEFRYNGQMLAADLSWMLVCSDYETASHAAQRLNTHAFLAAAGRYVDMGGGEVYVDDNGRQVDDALAVVRSLADNGNEQAKSFFAEYSEDAWEEMADEALEVMGRVH